MIIDVKTFWHLFLSFHGGEKVELTFNCWYSYRIHIIVNGCYWNTCKLVFTKTDTQLFGLVLVSPLQAMNAAYARPICNYAVLSNHAYN